MRNGISGTSIPGHLPFASEIQQACVAKGFWPCVAYAIAWNETLSGGAENACSAISFDKGYGLFQLTSPFVEPWPPYNWNDAATNTEYALDHYLIPGSNYFIECGVSGETLVKLIAAGFNEGNDAAWANHLAGNTDLGTTDNYGARALANYNRLIQGEDPI